MSDRFFKQSQLENFSADASLKTLKIQQNETSQIVSFGEDFEKSDGKRTTWFDSVADTGYMMGAGIPTVSTIYLVADDEDKKFTNSVYLWLAGAENPVWLAGGASTDNAALNEKLRAWANSEAYSLTAITYNDDNAVETANVVWPDGSTGVFTSDSFDDNFPNNIRSFHVTYIAGGITKTITQAAVTRDDNGNVTSQPTLTIA